MGSLLISGLVSLPREIHQSELGNLPGAGDGVVPLASILEAARPSASADHATVVAGDDYRASIPLADLRDGGRLELGDGSLRLTVEQGSTLCWNVKDLVAIVVTAGKAPDSIPETPTH